MPPIKTMRKRRLGQFLAELRRAAGRTEADFERLTRKSQATLSRIESGLTLPDWNVLGAMLTFYDATEEEVARAEEMWTEAKADSKAVEHSIAYNPKARALVRAEYDAASVRNTETLTVPGPMQTRGYAAAVRRSAHHFASPRVSDEKVIAARVSRAKRLEGPDALVIHALIDEGVVRRVVGGPTVMAEQLRHLIELQALPNVTIQVIPFDAGSYGSMSGGCSIILSYPDDDAQDDVYLEYPGGGEWVDNQEDVQKFAASFDEIAATVALSPKESTRLIAHIATTLEEA